VFFVRVANKGLMLDAASSASMGEKRFRVDPSTPLPSRLRVNRAGTLKLKCEEKERAHPRVFCERVRNSLMAKGLGKHSFLKSGEEHENRGVKFVDFVAKSEKSERAEIGMAPSRLRVNGRELDREPHVKLQEGLRASR
jgi:hypothetical protein